MFCLDLPSALERHHVRYLLVGGLALDGANLDHFILLADELGLRPTLPVSLAELGDAGKRASWVSERHMVAFSLRGPENSTPTVDVLIGADLPFDEAYGRRPMREVAGIPVFLAAAVDMIALKEQAGRAQDLADIEHLKRLAHG